MKGISLSVVVVIGLWSLFFGCASGDDDDSTSSGSDDDTDDDDDDAADDDSTDDDDTDDDAADDDVADDDTGPTDEQCELIWTTCESEFEIASDADLKMLCGDEPDMFEDWEAWRAWRRCTAERLRDDYAALDECGSQQGCEDSMHEYFECRSDYFAGIVHCCDQEFYVTCENELEAATWCEDV